MKLIHRSPFCSHSVSGHRRSQNATFSVAMQGKQRAPSLPSSNMHVGGPLRHTSFAPLAPKARPAAAVAAAPSAAPAVVVSLPASQQEAVEAAVQCLLPALAPLLASKPAKAAKGFSGPSRPGSTSQPSNRFSIEIPVADPSAQAALDLTHRLISTTSSSPAPTS
ncbi:hypothetical protein Agub_g11826, partial [Astrephomene gubernaculifera]